MRVLLDESLPHDLIPFLQDHEVRTVQGCGWAGRKNGDLLALAAPDFDVFLTADSNLPHQQQLAAFDISVVIVRANRNRIQDLEPLVPKILEALSSAPKGKPTWVAA